MVLRVYAASSSSLSTIRLVMQIVVSLALLLACLLVVLSNKYDPNSKHWAFGMLGTIVGFWLRGVR
jgi:hypothetical protein